MKILSTTPVKHKTQLDPNRANENTDYLVRAGKDAFSKRFSHSTIDLQYHADCSTGYTQANTAETLTYRIPAAQTIWIEGLLLDGYTAGALDISLLDGSGATPAGITNPIVSATGTTSEVVAQQFEIPAGSTYRLTASGTGFSTTRLDLMLMLKSDRHNVSGLDVYSDPDATGLTRFTEANTLDATAYNLNKTTIATAATTNAGHATALKPMFFCAHNFTNATDGYTLEWAIPASYSTNHRCRVVRMDVYAVYTSAGAGGSTITWTLKDSAGASTGLSAAASMSGVVFATASDTSPAVVLTGSNSNEPSNTANDYTLTVANNTATNCIKSYCYLFVE